MYTILTTGRDTNLLLRRNDELALAGFRVVSPRRAEEAPSLALQLHVDAVVIGATVEQPARAVLIEQIRKLIPHTLLVCMYSTPESSADPRADISLDVNQGMQPLIEALRSHLAHFKSA